MTYKDIVEFISNLNIYKSKRMIYLKNHHPEVLNEIFEKTKFLDDTNEKNIEITFQERMYCIENNLHKRPRCIECNDYVYFKKDENRYRDFCSVECAKGSKQTRKRREETNLRRYGVRRYTNSKKIKETMIKRYGESYGKMVAEKRKKTNLEKYGDPNYINTEKIKETMKSRYGVDFPFQSEEIRKKSIETFAERNNGISCVFDLPEIRKKTNDGIRERSYNFILNSDYAKPCFTLEEYLSCNVRDELEFECKRCGTHYKAIWDNGVCNRCPKCYPNLGTSKPEIDIYDFIKSKLPKGYSVMHKESLNRSLIYPHELDILANDNNDRIILAIEYDGLFYHSFESGKGINYHLEKTKACEEKGIKLIHIFENEWLAKENIVKSRILDNLGVYDNTVYARKCKIREVDNETKSIFLFNNHLQGDCSSKVNLGLYDGDELISLMTFSKTRFNKKYDWELARFCNKIGYHIPGAAGKILKYFERNYNPISLLSYADIRWSNGNVYEKLGFSLDHISKPNYWYFKPHSPARLYNRVGFQKHKLKDILEQYDPSESESKNMSNNGYYRIYDCGNLVYVKTYNSPSATS